MPNTPWPDERLAELRHLWDEGHAASEIGRRMGISKNTVVGKARRLGLPGRPSPIKRTSNLEPMAAIGPRKVPSLTELMTDPAIARRVSASERSHQACVKRRNTLVAASPKTAAPLPVLRPRTAACCWPVGEPGDRDFRFCEQATLLGKSYCDAHAKLAYLPVRSRLAADTPADQSPDALR